MIKKTCFTIALTFLAAHTAVAALIDNWNVTVQNEFRVLPVLAAQEEVETYTGDIALYDTVQKPTDGNLFVLVGLRIEQMPLATTPFNPEEVLLNVSGKTYQRLTPDDFLEKFKYTPLPHLKIKKGTFEGVLVYEIPESEKDQPLSLSYQKETISTK